MDHCLVEPVSGNGLQLHGHLCTLEASIDGGDSMDPSFLMSRIIETFKFVPQSNLAVNKASYTDVPNSNLLFHGKNYKEGFQQEPKAGSRI